jgi:uncharacterized protein (TIGR01777 family)
MDCERLPAKVLITGGSGLVGRAFKKRLAGCGITPVELSHRTRPGAFTWNAERGDVPPPEAFEGVRAVVHLAGAPIARRWSEAAKRAIHDSRVNGTRAIAEAIAALPSEKRPEVFVSMSGIAVYGIHRKETRLDERAGMAPAPGEFLPNLAREWEAVTGPAVRAGVRTVLLRTGMVLARDGGALAKMLPVFKLGLGGPAGDGAQRLAWISVDDLVSLIFFALRTPGLSGPVNAVSPHTVTNADFARALGFAIHRPTSITAPVFALRALFGKMAEETILSDLAPFPAKAMEAGFQFRHPTLQGALEEILHGHA